MHQQLLLICLGFGGGMLVTAFIPLVFTPVGKSAIPRFDPGSGFAILEYHWSLRLLTAALVCDPLILFPAVGIFAGAGLGAWLVLIAAIIIFSGVSVLLLIEVARVRITLNEEGIRSRSPWHRECFIRWDEITVLRGKFMNGLQVRSDDCKLIVPQHVQGMAYLLDAIRARVPGEIRRKSGMWSLAR